jgi:aminodeoxychorismate synthase component I
MRLVMIDNYDSFTYNLVQLFYEFDLEVLVFRHDAISLEEITALNPRWLCISPGPKAPAQAGISKAVIAHFYQKIPILGVCLGHQAINEVFGGATRQAPVPVHGKRHQVFHSGRGIFQGLPSPFGAARYHSLMAVPNSPDLEITAWTADGVVMGLSHRKFPLHGVQFHPESFLTSHGHALAANFLALGGSGRLVGEVRDEVTAPPPKTIFTQGKTMFGRIVDIEVQPYEPPPGVQDLADLFSAVRLRPYAMLLLSGGDLDCAGHSLMGWDPFLVLRARGRQVRVQRHGDTRVCDGDPFDVLEELLRALELPGESPLTPMAAGGMGFLAYDLKNHLERLPTVAFDDLLLPEMLVAFPRRLMVHDRRAGRFWQVGVTFEDAAGRRLVPEDQEIWPPALPVDAYRVGKPRSNFTRKAYLQALTRIREYIRQGDVYQVNLTQRFSFPLSGEPYYLFQRLFQLNPAPFFAYLNCDDFQVLSTSMERFLCRQGDYLETRPIKGTRPRGLTPAADAVLRQELAESPKDDAELSMIVDLLRNDLGKVCEARTVKVKEHKRLEAYQNVYHLVSVVTGQVRPAVSAVDILKATFPGGSITGCPKIRAMEIIDELEPHVRHVYCGAIGYLGCHRNLDLNVAIRTAIISRGQAHFAVGGGVVYDSNEEDEYDETLHKGRTLFRLIEGDL